MIRYVAKLSLRVDTQRVSLSCVHFLGGRGGPIEDFFFFFYSVAWIPEGRISRPQKPDIDAVKPSHARA